MVSRRFGLNNNFGWTGCGSEVEVRDPVRLKALQKSMDLKSIRGAADSFLEAG